jgi:hypothetical protein
MRALTFKTPAPSEPGCIVIVELLPWDQLGHAGTLSDFCVASHNFGRQQLLAPMAPQPKWYCRHDTLKVLVKVMKSFAKRFHMRLPAPVRNRHVQRLVPLILAAAVVQHSPTANAVTKTTWVDDTSTSNGNVNWPSQDGTYTRNFGIAFSTGNTSASYNIGWIDIGLNTSISTASSASFKVALHQATNSTPYSAVAASTAYATDVVSFSKPTTTSTPFTLQLTSAQLPNITSYAMNPATSYALIVYSPDVSIGMMRTTGSSYANGTTNNAYTVSNGFAMLTTLRSNSYYSNTTGSYPALDFAFGNFASPPAPVPAPLGVAGLAAMASNVRRLRSLSRRLQAPR